MCHCISLWNKPTWYVKPWLCLNHATITNKQQENVWPFLIVVQTRVTNDHHAAKYILMIPYKIYFLHSEVSISYISKFLVPSVCWLFISTRTTKVNKFSHIHLQDDARTYSSVRINWYVLWDSNFFHIQDIWYISTVSTQSALETKSLKDIITFFGNFFINFFIKVHEEGVTYLRNSKDT